jgi:hypothetical protein
MFILSITKVEMDHERAFLMSPRQLPAAETENLVPQFRVGCKRDWHRFCGWLI